MTETELTETGAQGRRSARPAREPGARGRCFDAAVRAYLVRHPEATVVALGEGLGTAFWRLDNGRLNWLTVQPPETAAVRRMLLPDGARRRTVARAVTDHDWLDAVREPQRGVIVTAPGVLMRLSPPAVRALLAACAERFPGGALVFDALPRWASALARRAAGPAGGRRPAPVRWGLDRAELPRLAAAHPGIVAVREIHRPDFPARYRHRIPVLRALTPLVCEVRFAGARCPGASRQP
ncbi:class I SAM-dependent methyltransferase [Streptomyces inhibens]|uniref:class I SAM-dependent methyltransferase n=1 Tax=Streptomyces inhibens TaxID=2293571 RepID=UPI001EE70AED|nr:class I SAM-dependent methyltransferase [Streptomyces inhibens]UKY49717.1 class I SAM-dependent methyltransferase [Streptomyces inhibens]